MLDLEESAWSRGRQDTKEKVATVSFWLVDGVVGALFAWLFHPLWFLTWVFASVGAIWVFQTLMAPIRQRNEARAALRDETGNGWLDILAATRRFRDLLEGSKAEYLAFYYDRWGKTEGKDPDLTYPRTFMYHLIDGANRIGAPRVRGRPENGESVVPVPLPLLSGMDAYQNTQKLMLTGSDGRAYRDIEIDPASIQEYVDWLGTADGIDLSHRREDR